MRTITALAFVLIGLVVVDAPAGDSKAISPVLHLAKDSPPTMLFFGTEDFLYKQGQEFIQGLEGTWPSE